MATLVSVPQFHATHELSAPTDSYIMLFLHSEEVTLLHHHLDVNKVIPGHGNDTIGPPLLTTAADGLCLTSGIIGRLQWLSLLRRLTRKW